MKMRKDSEYWSIDRAVWKGDTYMTRHNDVVMSCKDETLPSVAYNHQAALRYRERLQSALSGIPASVVRARSGSRHTQKGGKVAMLCGLHALINPSALLRFPNMIAVFDLYVQHGSTYKMFI